MSNGDVAAAIAARAERAGVRVPAPLASALAAYLELLARWNRTVNLTSLDVAGPSADAIDRLIVEPLVAAQLVAPTDRSLIDVGSGGGSPAIPMKLAHPALRFVLVEGKVRKSAFLREVVRQLGLSEIDVETRRVEDLAPGRGAADRFDLATMRAVRGDAAVTNAIHRLVAPGGRLFWFSRDRPPVVSGFLHEARTELVGAESSVHVFTRV